MSSSKTSRTAKKKPVSKTKTAVEAPDTKAMANQLDTATTNAKKAKSKPVSASAKKKAEVINSFSSHRVWPD